MLNFSKVMYFWRIRYECNIESEEFAQFSISQKCEIKAGDKVAKKYENKSN